LVETENVIPDPIRDPKRKEACHSVARHKRYIKRHSIGTTSFLKNNPEAKGGELTMINKKIAMSLISIVTALSLAGGATYAFFSDQATSQENTFTTGNADLLIANDVSGAPVGYANDIAGVTVTGMAPGTSNITNFWLKNHSTTDDGFSLTADLTDIDTTLGAALFGEILVTIQCDADNNGIGIGTDTVVGPKLLSAWGSDAPVSLGTRGANQGNSNALNGNSDQDELACRMTTTVDSDADNNVAGQTVSFDGTFDATQVPLP
jgi:predicted ribosomally synthesized peptide with SipW-like signal peptide